MWFLSLKASLSTELNTGSTVIMYYFSFFSDGDLNPSLQNSSQSDKCLTNMAMTEPTKVRDTVSFSFQATFLGGRKFRKGYKEIL